MTACSGVPSSTVDCSPELDAAAAGLGRGSPRQSEACKNGGACQNGVQEENKEVGRKKRGRGALRSPE